MECDSGRAGRLYVLIDFVNNLQFQLARMIDRHSLGDGVHQSIVPGVHCIKFSQTDEPAKRQWRASLGIVVQGSKEISLDYNVYRIDAVQYVAAPISLLVTSQIFAATPEKPFLSLLFDFDSLIVSEISAQLKAAPDESKKSARAVFIGQADNRMLETALRFDKIFKTPEDAAVLGQLVIKEMFYHLLKSSNGAAIQQFVRRGSKMHKISQAIYNLRAAISEDVDIAALAKAANMNRSDFFKHFKEATALSPIQYQKRLRLLEARRLMIEADETAESSALKVGYKSASQFSREYSRLFGSSPRRDATKIKKDNSFVQQI